MMITSFSSYDDELLNSAYANVTLIADETWVFDKKDPYRNCHRSLWIQIAKLAEKFKNDDAERTKRASNFPAESHGSSHGNRERDEDGNSKQSDEFTSTVGTSTNSLYSNQVPEPWMLPAVEECFARLTSMNVSRADYYLTGLSAVKERESGGSSEENIADQNFKSNWSDIFTSRYLGQATSLYERNRISKHCELFTLSKPRSTEMESEERAKYADPRAYVVNGPDEMRLYARLSCKSVRDLWDPTMRLHQRRVLHGSRKHCQQQQQQQQQQQLQRQQQQQHVAYGQSISASPRENVAKSSGVSRNRQHQQHQLHQQHYHVATHHCLPFLPQKINYQVTSMESHDTSRKQQQSMLPPIPTSFTDPPAMDFYSNVPAICGNANQKVKRLQYFPSLNERSYQNELFPYKQAHETGGSMGIQNSGVPMFATTDTGNVLQRMPYQWIQRATTSGRIQIPITTTSHSIYNTLQPIVPGTMIDPRSQQMHKFMLPDPMNPTPISIYQRPQEPQCQNVVAPTTIVAPTSIQKRNNNNGKRSEESSFGNLIVLTKSAMKTRCKRSKSPQQRPKFTLEGQQARTSDFQWLSKGQPKRSKDIVGLNKMESCSYEEDKRDYRGVTTSWNINDASSRQQTMDQHAKQQQHQQPGKKVVVDNVNAIKFKNEIDVDCDTQIKKRLYRDVLTNNTSSADIVLENAYERRYDELEKQAMEQYRTSDESLALKYQELERQAVEQYRYCGDMQDPASAPRMPVNARQSDEKLQLVEERRGCYGGRKCAGPGKCSPTKQEQEKARKGAIVQPQITLLRPETKSEGSINGRSSTRRCALPMIVSKSFSTLTRNDCQEIEGVTAGGSGDRLIDEDTKFRRNSEKENQRFKQMQSSKRCLILVSPYKCESEIGGLSSSKDLCCLSRAKENFFGRCRDSEAARIVDSDEDIAIV